MTADGVRRLADWSVTHPTGIKDPNATRTLGPHLLIPRSFALSQRQPAAPVPRQGLDAELSERAECARPEASARASAEALRT